MAVPLDFGWVDIVKETGRFCSSWCLDWTGNPFSVFLALPLQILAILAVTNNNSKLTGGIVEKAPIWGHMAVLLKEAWDFATVEFLFGKRRRASSELFGASNVLSFFLTLSWHILAILTVTNNNRNLNFGIVERGSDLGAHGCRSGSRLYQGWGVQMTKMAPNLLSYNPSCRAGTGPGHLSPVL